MKKVFILLVSLLAMMSASLSVKAQDVTITLLPGWNWISYTNAVQMDIAAAMGDFVPTEGDVLKSAYGFATYHNGSWIGGLQEFTPGFGYLYCSNRTSPVSFVYVRAFNSHAVTTAVPTSITAMSAKVESTVTIDEGNQIYVRGVCWGTEEMPTKNGNHMCVEAVTGSQSITLYGLTPSTTYYVRAYMVSDYGLVYGNQQSFTTDAGHGYVDLGLPSGLLWATCNVGSETPEEYGDYFAWGETQPKSTYNWSTYQYCMGSISTITKYCSNSSFGYNGFTDNLTTLLPEDDAATVNWGGNWRMPTKEEWQELYNNTTVTWATQNGVNGKLFTASNGNSLFLPAAGIRNDNNLDFAGVYGGYWSSSLYTVYPIDACYIIFGSDVDEIDDIHRSEGFTVRPVSSLSSTIDATANPSEGGEVSGGGTYQVGSECTLTATPNEGYSFTNWTENDDVVSTDATYTFTVNTNRTLVANFDLDRDYVDLGLPSGNLWATCNVGANAPEEYGDYFAWGETMPKNTYNLSTYQYANGTSWVNPQLTKYCNNSNSGYNGFTDNLSTLLPEDDAATANWSGNWRMPTKEEWQELYNNTTVTWVTQNGVNGKLFTARNGNSLFLPAAGIRNDNNLDFAGVYGGYWSSSLYTGNPIYACYIVFSSDADETDVIHRSEGFTVRPVHSGQN